MTSLKHIQAIDTGTTLLYVPDHVAKQFYAMVSNRCYTPDKNIPSWSFRVFSRSPVQAPQHNMDRVRESTPYALRVNNVRGPTYTGFWMFPCSSHFTLALSFSGQEFSINLSDFNLGRISSDSSYVHSCIFLFLILTLNAIYRDCVGGILALGDGFPQNLAIIGMRGLLHRSRSHTHFSQVMSSWNRGTQYLTTPMALALGSLQASTTNDWCS